MSGSTLGSTSEALLGLLSKYDFQPHLHHARIGSGSDSSERRRTEVRAHGVRASEKWRVRKVEELAPVLEANVFADQRVFYHREVRVDQTWGTERSTPG